LLTALVLDIQDRWVVGGNTMGLGACAQMAIIAAAVLLSPVLAFLMAIAIEVLVGLMAEAGTLVLSALVAAGAIGWTLFRKLRRRTPVET
jgi:hypothetical protein